MANNPVPNKISVTGAAGFIGSRLAERMLDSGWSVRGVDLKPEAPSRLAGRAGFSYHPADITDPREMADILGDSSALVHCAALVHRGSRDLSRGNYFRINFEGTRNVLEAASGPRLKQILFLSTVAVYGDTAGGPTPSEDTPPRPCDAYGESKRDAEELVREGAARRGIPHTILRPAPVYGRGFLLNLRKRILLPGGAVFYRIGAGRGLISLCSVLNLVDAVAACLGEPGRFAGTFNMKDREDYTQSDIIRACRRPLGKSGRPVLPIPGWLPEMAAAILGAAAPKRSRDLRTRVRKITRDSLFSGEKLWKTGFRPAWDLEGTLKGPFPGGETP